MGEFTANEKYSDSYRLDHPDFKDVSKTTFAKGTIKEFDKISDDPLKVRSMVKVEVEGSGESDFIPLFFHPKKEYWDDEEEDIKATDFNQGKKYFEQAWMSFREGDEVRVMLRDGAPYAVMGFHDGVPRVGENILKIEGSGHRFHVIFHPINKDEPLEDYQYDEPEVEAKGPDGKELGLKHECIVVHQAQYQQEPSEQAQWPMFDFLPNPDHPYTNMPNQDIANQLSCVNPCEDFECWSYHAHLPATVPGVIFHTKDILVPIGPVLYLIQIVVAEINRPVPHNELLEIYWGIPPYGGHGFEYSMEHPDIDPRTLESTSSRQVSAGETVSHDFIVTYPWPAPNPEDHCNFTVTQTLKIAEDTPPAPPYYDPHALCVKAAPYSKELYDRALGGPDSVVNPLDAGINPLDDKWTNVYKDFVYQQDFHKNDVLHGLIGSVIALSFDEKYLVRPHTKEELQDAGMWPET